MTLVLAGNYATTRLDKSRASPRRSPASASTARARCACRPTGAGWYDVPSLALSNGYLSQFTEAIYRFGGDASVSLGFGVDPWCSTATQMNGPSAAKCSSKT